MATIYGMGELTGFTIYSREDTGTVVSTNQILGFVVDDVTKELTINQLALINVGVIQTPPPISMGVYDAVNEAYQFAFNVKIPFRNSLRIYARNGAAAGNDFHASGLVLYTLVR